jgi:hypothetical protein
VLVVTILHAGLSWSSLLFHIPAKRNKSNPMIWPEFRWHSICFACRSFVAMYWVAALTLLGVDLNAPVAKAGRARASRSSLATCTLPTA